MKNIKVTKSIKVYLGIDPGQSGGLALLDEGGAVIEACAMPAEEALFARLEAWRDAYSIVGATLEKVRSSPQMSKGSIFVFGWGYGGLRMALLGCRIPFEEVAPQKWQKVVGVRDKTGARELKAVNTTEKKNRHKAEAQSLWPLLKVTHSLADALLIAEYGRRWARGFGAELPK